MRIGVEAGEVLVDVERAAGPRDRMLTGDAVNTAARLQTAAEPGHIVVGPGVYARTKDVIEYRELEPLTLKGKAEPVPAWRRAPHQGAHARRAAAARPRGAARRARRGARGPEADAPPRRDRGPAGARHDRRAGRRRQVAAGRRARAYVEGLPQIVYWRRGRCLAYGNTSYSAFADAIKAQCEIFEDDAAEVAAKKADAAVARAVRRRGRRAADPRARRRRRGRAR